MGHYDEQIEKEVEAELERDKKSLAKGCGTKHKTRDLRFVKKEGRMILQQKHVEYYGLASKTTWVDVPLVEEEDETV